MRPEKKNTTVSKAVLYARVSSREQAEGYSIDAQLKLLRDYAYQQGLSIAKEFIDVETAKKCGRPQFGEMLAYFQKHTSTVHLLVEKTDRLYRNFRDYVALDDYELEIHLVKEGTLLSHRSTSHEKFIHGIKVLMAKNYIDNLREEVTKGMLEKASKGLPPGRPPIGYRNNKVTRGINLDPVQGPWVQKMFAWYASREFSLERLSRHLYGAGFTYQPTRPKINASTLEKVLKNPFYIGRFKFGEHAFEGTYPRLITVEQFEAVQAAFRSANHTKQQKHNFTFSGLVSCEECGCAVTAEIKKGRYVYYHCTGRKGPCSQKRKAVREEELIRQFGDIVQGVTIGPEVVEDMKTGLKASAAEEARFHRDTLETITQRIEAVQVRLEKAFEAKLDGAVPEDLWRKKSQEWQLELQHLRENLAQHQGAKQAFYEQGFKLLELAERAYLLYQKHDRAKMRALVQILCSNSVLRDGAITAAYRQPFDRLVLGKKQAAASMVGGGGKTPALEKWWSHGESNSRPLACHASALPTEL